MKRFLMVLVLLVGFAGITSTAEARERGRAFTPTIAEIAAGNPDFSILVAALDAAGLVDVFDNNRHFTVFAPVNQAFVELLDDLGLTAEELLGNKDLLTSVLFYHVTRGDRNSASLIGAGSVKMLDGNSAAITLENGNAYINDAMIVQPNIRARNGIIHVIDKVLLPPTK
jgi:uncharacterized surface protein with fasciclin (FAS1) repeats